MKLYSIPQSFTPYGKDELFADITINHLYEAAGIPLNEGVILAFTEREIFHNLEWHTRRSIQEANSLRQVNGLFNRKHLHLKMTEILKSTH